MTENILTKCARTRITSEVRPVRQTGCHFATLCNNVDNAFLYEVHLGADCALPNDVVAWLEHLILQFGDDLRHEVGIGVCEEWHRGNERSAIEIDYFLPTDENMTYVTIENGGCTATVWSQINRIRHLSDSLDICIYFRECYLHLILMLI